MPLSNPWANHSDARDRIAQRGAANTDQEPNADTLERTKIIYWVLTLLLMVPAAGGGVVELFTSGLQGVVQTMLALGYPLYLMKILGISTILGGIAVLTGRVPKSKEWAYAGFSFDFLGATASHLLAGDASHAIYPLLFFVVLMGSYALWMKTSATPAR